MTLRTTLSRRRFDIAIAVALFALSLGIRLSHHANTKGNRPLRADAAGYILIAANLQRFGVYSRDSPPARGVAPERRTGIQPGYPLLLSAVLGTTKSPSDFLDRVILLQAILGSLLPVLVLALARIALPLLPSAAAAMAVALSPHLIALEAFVLSDAAFSFGLVASLLLFVRASLQPGFPIAFAAGLALGLTQLIREIATPLPFLLAPLLLLDWQGAARSEQRVMLKRVAVLLLGAALIWIPQQWVMAVHAEGHPTEEINSPWLLFVHGSIVDLAHETDLSKRPPDFERMTNDFEYGSRVVWKRFLEEPGRHLGWYLGGKALFMWRWENLYNGGVYQYPMILEGFDSNALFRGLRATMRALHWPLHALALLSLPLLWADWRRGSTREFTKVAAPLLVVILYHVALLTLFMPIPRYSIPLRPFVSVLAAGVCVRGIAAWRERSS